MADKDKTTKSDASQVEAAPVIDPNRIKLLAELTGKTEAEVLASETARMSGKKQAAAVVADAS